jgi:cell division protease FtsH
MMHWIACLLAGQAAEKLIYEKALLGAGGSTDSDLARATSVAVDLETGYGVAADMPLLYRTPANVSETLLYNPVLSDRVHRRLEAAQAVAQALLKERRAVLDNLAEKLTTEIVMDGDRFRSALMAMPHL